MQQMANDELTLVRRAGSGDNVAFREIVENHKKKIFFLAYDLTGSEQEAEDLSQEVFIKAFRSLKKFRGDASIGSWLYRITLNTYIDQSRKLSTHIEKQTQILDENRDSACETRITGVIESPEQFADSQQIQVHVARALTQISKKERIVFVLRHNQGFSVKGVAEIMKISEGTVKSLHFRAIRKLQKKLAFYRGTVHQEVVQ